MVNMALLKNPYNWLVVWTMLAVGWFAFHSVRKAIPDTDT